MTQTTSCDAGIECATDAHGRFTAVFKRGNETKTVKAEVGVSLR